jgi:hypothetical protein
MKRNLSLVLMLALAAVVVLSGCDRDKPKTGKVNLPSAPPKAPQGLHALSAGPGPEPFTKSDVAAYLVKHNLPRNLSSATTIQVENLEFLNSSDVSARLAGEKTGLADNARLGFATLRGEFLLTGPSGTKVARFTRAYAAFDAASGNLLMVGTLPEEDDSKPANGKPRG